MVSLEFLFDTILPMTLRSTQTITEMRPRAKGGRCVHGAGNLTTLGALT